MATYTLVISTTADQETALDSVLSAHNAANPKAPMADKSAYLSMVLNSAIQSYAKQYAVSVADAFDKADQATKDVVLTTLGLKGEAKPK